jgi:exodeoxyribonuclease III
MLRGMRPDGVRDWSVYILRCGDGSLYTGVAKDVSRRLKQHAAGRGAAYTRTHAPVELVYSEDALTRSEALVREAAVKRLPRPAKEKLVSEGKQEKPLKIATFNANSLRARMPIVLDWLAREKPDLLALQETKVTDEKFPREELEKAGWHVAFKGQKGYNGVAMVSRKPLEQVRLHIDPDDPQEEARFMTALVGDLLVVNTYVPQGYMIDSPKFVKKLKFFADLKALFRRTIGKDTAALWLGDLNVAPTEIDLWDPKRNALHVCYHPRAREAFAEARGETWIDLFREKEKGPGHYTFWDYLWPANFEKNRGWRIDHILGTPAAAQRLRRVWIDKGPRSMERPSDHTFLAGEFGPR